MTVFSADSILKTAVEVEEKAASFYRKAAELHKTAADALRNLAQMESGHAQALGALREGLKASGAATKRGPLGDVRDYLSVVADSTSGEGRRKRPELTGKETVAEILSAAIEDEKSAILFYAGVRQLVSSSEADALLERIVEEEMSHVSTLYRLRKACH